MKRKQGRGKQYRRKREKYIKSLIILLTNNHRWSWPALLNIAGMFKNPFFGFLLHLPLNRTKESQGSSLMLDSLEKVHP